MFTLVLLILVVLVAEGLARGVQYFLAEREFPVPVIPAKQPDAYRVMLFGGSTVEGAPLAEFSFVAQLEYQLRKLQPDRTLEIINLGRSSKSSAYVQAMLERTIDKSPDLLIVLSGHNEFLFDRFDLPPKLTESSLRTLGKRLAASLTKRLAKAGSADQYAPRELDAWQRGSEEFQRKLAEYDANMKAIAELAIAADVPLILATLPSNHSDWPPAYRDLRGSYFSPEYATRLDQLYSGLRAGDLDAVRRDQAALAEQYPDSDASLIYIAAQLRKHDGDVTAAENLLRRAKDLDPLPWRALSRFNATVRELGDRPGIYLADIENAFRQFAGEQLIGYELIADNCHPTPLGSALMMHELFTIMAEQQLFFDQPQKLPGAEKTLDEFMAKAIANNELEKLNQRYYFTLAKYSMKAPFYHFSASRMYSERQLEIDAQDWRAWANLGTLSLLTDDRDSGMRQLEIAKRYKGSELDPDDRSVTPYLREALARSQLAKPAEQLIN